MFIKSKKLRLCMLIFFGIILIVFSVAGYRYFKVYQLKEKLSEVQNDSSITIFSYKKGEYDLGLRLNKQILLEDNDVNIFVQKLIKLPFSYDKSYSKGMSFSYGKDFEKIDIYITTELVLVFHMHVGKCSLLVSSNHGTDSYKLDFDMWYQFYNWLFSQ